MAAKTFEFMTTIWPRLAQVPKPILAVAELIWDAVDADADEITVSLRDDALGGLESI